jgi:mannose/fructose/N-acetylgalactosamine-specific phosphotransferase system component IIC
VTGFETALVAMALGGLLAVERKGLAQLMLARPIVVAPLVAWALGNARTGLSVGIPLELFFLGSSSYGASTPDHEALAAMFAAALATAVGGELRPSNAALAVAVFFALPFAPLGRRLEAGIERRNTLLVDEAEQFVAEGHLGRATFHAVFSLAVTAITGAVVVGLGIALAGPVRVFEGVLPAWIDTGLSSSWALFLGFSAAFGLRSIRVRGGPVLSGVAAVTVFVVFAAGAFLLGATP